MDERNDDPAASVEDTARRVRDAAGSAVNDAKHAAKQSVENARAKAGDAGHSTASRLRGFAGQVEDLPWMATAFNKSADGLDSVTNSLTHGDLNQCMSGVSDFARRQPAIFLGASVALGFALARVGKTALESSKPAETSPPADKVPYGEASGAYTVGSEV
ncbi:MAG: hypothetical protein QM773_06135 [Hyphomonadaceae bacterium]